jgi:hypothetical protein
MGTRRIIKKVAGVGARTMGGTSRRTMARQVLMKNVKWRMY